VEYEKLFKVLVLLYWAVWAKYLLKYVRVPIVDTVLNRPLQYLKSVFSKCDRFLEGMNTEDSCSRIFGSLLTSKTQETTSVVHERGTSIVALASAWLRRFSRRCLLVGVRLTKAFDPLCVRSACDFPGAVAHWPRSLRSGASSTAVV